jgi:hypothetical protein
MSPTSRVPFQQEASREEKVKLLREDRTAGTRVAYNNIVSPEPSGRWAKPSRSEDPATLYPRLPSSSPWHRDPIPDEPAFGIDIEAVEPCGTDAEIERAAQLLFAELAEPPPLGNVADLPPLLRSAMGPSPLPEVTSPLSSDDSATDPTSSLGSDPSFTPDQQLAQPSTTDAPKDVVSVKRAGAGSLSWRRLGL